jgi:hypothetical protein
MDQRLMGAPACIAGKDHLVGSDAAFRPLVALLGVIWLINAGFQFYAWVWQPMRGSGTGLAHALAKAVAAAPAWLRPAVLAIAAGVNQLGPIGVASAMVVVALLLGLALISRIGLRTAGWCGIAYSIFCWVALAAFGAPYGPGATDPGVFPVYLIAFVFVLSVAQSSASLWTAGRLLFGLLWAFDAALKWQPYFLTHFLAELTPAVHGQPAWIAAYITFVITVVKAVGPQLVAVVVAITETAIAVSLLTGRGLQVVAPLGFLYALAVWTTAEGWGGPYTPAGTGIRGDVLGASVIYAVVFLFLLVPVMQRVRAWRARTLAS